MVEAKKHNDTPDNEMSAPSTSAIASSQAQNEDPEEQKSSSKRGRSGRSGNNKVSSTGDEELVINTSEKLEVVDSFDKLGIPEQLLRGKFTYHPVINRSPKIVILLLRPICLWVQQAFGSSAASHLAHY